MLNLKFLRGRRSSADTDNMQGDADWENPRTGAELLATPYRQQLLKAIQESTSLTQPVFDAYVKEPVQRYAERIQLLPASESHHHSYPGGMLDHGLETCVFGLRLRRQHLLPPKESPEKQSSTGELWSVAVIYACLLHDIAKAIVDIDIHLKSGRRWCLWEGVIPDKYRVRYVKGRDYFLHSATNLLLCKEVVGNSGLEWLRSQPDLFGLVMYTASGHSERSGIVGEIVSQADRASVAKSLGGKVSNLEKAPRDSLQSKLKSAIRHIVKEKLRLNEKGAQGFVTAEALWLVTPLVPREIKSYLLSHGIEGVPSNETRLYDEMQSHGLIVESAEGRSVWKCRVEIDDWSADLSMIKVHKSVVWEKEDAPEFFKGIVSCRFAGGSDQASGEFLDSEGKGGIETPGDVIVKQVDNMDVGERIHGEKGGGEQEGLNDDILKLIPGEDDSLRSEGRNEPEEVSSDHSSCYGEGVEIAQCKQPMMDGEEFWRWLKESLESHKLIMNDSKAMVHSVGGRLFLVSPKIFKRYCMESFGEDGGWRKIQGNFQKLKKHEKDAEGKNIVQVTVKGPNRQPAFLKGYLLKPDAGLLRIVPPDNPFIVTASGEQP